MTIKPKSNRNRSGSIRGARKGSKHALTHGLNTLKHAINGVGNRVIDRRTVTGKALAKWRADLVQDLGGDDSISTQQSAIIDLAVKSKLLLDSIDVWLLTQPSLINVRKRTLLPVVVQRQQLADGLVRYLQTLGLKRVAKPTQTLDDYVRENTATSLMKPIKPTLAMRRISQDPQCSQDDREAQPEADSATAPNGEKVN